MPPNMTILVRGIGMVLGLVVVVSAVTGVVTRSPLVALNAAGFIGTCALSLSAMFYSVALERMGLSGARKAAVTLVQVLLGSAVLMTVVFFVLLRESRFRDEAVRFGLHSVAGIAVLVVLVAVLGVAWYES